MLLACPHLILDFVSLSHCIYKYSSHDDLVDFQNQNHLKMNLEETQSLLLKALGLARMATGVSEPAFGLIATGLSEPARFFTGLRDPFTLT